MRLTNIHINYHIFLNKKCRKKDLTHQVLKQLIYNFTFNFMRKNCETLYKNSGFFVFARGFLRNCTRKENITINAFTKLVKKNFIIQFE